MPPSLLEVEHLSVEFSTQDGPVRAVNDVSLSLHPGEILAVVGESGSGKSTLGLSLMRLLPYAGRITAGNIRFEGRDLLGLKERELNHIRGKQISMIFQDPIAGLNPVLPIGTQVGEILASHLNLNKKERAQRAVEVLRNVGLPDPEHVAGEYPYHLSGGSGQRVMIGMATALNPRIIIADEPTSSLDVTVQAQILSQLDRLRSETGTAIMLITHDFGVVAQLADRVAVMYGGKIVEQGEVPAVFRRPQHPYTWALLQALPRADVRDRELRPIRGSAPSLLNLPPQCSFTARCPKALNRCRQEDAPPLVEAEPGHVVACYNPVFHAWGDDADED